MCVIASLLDGLIQENVILNDSFFYQLKIQIERYVKACLHLICFEIDNVIEKKRVNFSLLLDIFVVVQNYASYPILVSLVESVINYRLKQIPSSSSNNESLGIC